MAGVDRFTKGTGRTSKKWFLSLILYKRGPSRRKDLLRRNKEKIDGHRLAERGQVVQYELRMWVRDRR